MNRHGLEVCNITEIWAKFAHESRVEKAMTEWVNACKDKGRKVSLIRQSSSNTGVFYTMEIFDNQDQVEQITQDTFAAKSKLYTAVRDSVAKQSSYHRTNIIRASSIQRETANEKINYYLFEVKGNPKEFLDTAEIVSDYLENIGWQFYWFEYTSGLLGRFMLLVSTDSQEIHDHNYASALDDPSFTLHWYRLFELCHINPTHNRARSLIKLNE
jgi:hypothetical protein